MRRVRVAYLRKNLPPFVSDVFSLAKGIALVPLTRSPAKMRTVNLREKKSSAARKGKNKPGKMGTKAREVAEEALMDSVAVWKDVAHAVYNTKQFIYTE